MTVLADTLQQTREVCDELRVRRRAIKQARTQIYIYKNNRDGTPGLIFQGRVHIQECTKYQFPQRDNVSSPGFFEIRASHHIAKFIATVPNNPDECKNIVIRVDRYGGIWRWSGLMHHWDIETRDGCDYLVATFNDDLQCLQFMLGPPNPLLPLDVFQFPRDFISFSPSRWSISSFILLHIIRLEGNLWQLPDDPFDIDSWFPLSLLDFANWQVHIKCPSFSQDTSLWTALASRMNTVDSVIADALEDAQLSIVYRRYFTAEGEKPTGLLNNNIANGALVLEIADRSGFTAADGTVFGGTAAGGFGRSVLTWVSGFVEDTLVQVTDSEALYPDEYYQSSWLASLAAAPSICLRDSHWNDLQSKISHSPASAVKVIIGGDNPVADAIVQLIIQAAGNLIGYFLLGGFDSLGDIASDIIMPFLVGTILAWIEMKNFGRATNLGWVHLHEIYQRGAEAAVWSFAALEVLRGGFNATRAETSHTLVVGDHTWFIPGLHASIGDRIASTSGALRRNAGINLLFVNQMKEMGLVGDGDGHDEFMVKIGLNKAGMTSGERTARMMKKALDAINDIGVRLVS